MPFEYVCGMPGPIQPKSVPFTRSQSAPGPRTPDRAHPTNPHPPGHPPSLIHLEYPQTPIHPDKPYHPHPAPVSPIPHPNPAPVSRIPSPR